MGKWVKVRNMGIVAQPNFDAVYYSPPMGGAASYISSEKAAECAQLWLPESGAPSQFELMTIDTHVKGLGFERGMRFKGGK